MGAKFLWSKKGVINMERIKARMNPTVWPWDQRYELMTLNTDKQRSREMKIQEGREIQMIGRQINKNVCAKSTMIFWIGFWNRKRVLMEKLMKYK